MQIFSKKTLTVAVTVVLGGLGAVSTAYAVDTQAYSLLTISNLVWDNTTLGRQVDFGDFSSINIGNSASDSASLSPGGNDSHAAPTGLGDKNPVQACVGAGGAGTGACAPIGDNDITIHSGQYLVRGDANLAGAIITGAPGQSSPANALAVTETQLDGLVSNGNGNGQVGTGTTLTFSVGQGGTFSFSLDGALHVLADVNAAAGEPGSSALATANFKMTIADSTGDVFVWDPGTSITGGTETLTGCTGFGGDALTSSATANIPGDHQERDFSCHYAAGGVALTAGVQYTFTIDHKVNSNAAQVFPTPTPEPTTLALMGLGLLGVAGVARRRTKA